MSFVDKLLFFSFYFVALVFVAILLVRCVVLNYFERDWSVNVDKTMPNQGSLSSFIKPFQPHHIFSTVVMTKLLLPMSQINIHA